MGDTFEMGGGFGERDSEKRTVILAINYRNEVLMDCT
jgi:hypothetical protein